MTQRVLSAALLALVLLGGCSDAEAGSSDLPTLKASPSRSASTELRGLPDGVPTEPPTEPASVDRRTNAGAKAYAAYVMATYWYAVSSHDVDPLLALTPDGTCPTCKETARNLSTGSEIYEVPDETPTPKETEILAKDGSVWHLSMLVDLPSGTRIYADGNQPDERIHGQRNRVMEVDLIWGSGSWQLGQYRFPDA